MSANLDPAHVAVLATTVSEYSKGAEDLTVRNRPLLSYARKYNRFQYNCSGTSSTWQVKYKQPPISQAGDDGNISFNVNTAYKQATLPWRGYQGTDRLTELQKQMNKGLPALINLYEGKVDELIQSFNDTFPSQLYVDGNASGYENAFHGLNSFTGAANSAATNLVSNPSDSYAGLTTNLGTYGGTWTANRSSSESPQYPNATIAKDWPWGSGTSEYDFWAPKLVNTTGTGWTGSTKFQDNCEEVINRTSLWLASTGGSDGPMLGVFGGDMFGDIRKFFAARNRQIVPNKEATDLGFGDTINLNGVALIHDFDCPASSGFMFRVSAMKLKFLYSKMFEIKGPEYDIHTNSYLMLLNCYGNAQFSPKHVAKLNAYA